MPCTRESARAFKAPANLQFRKRFLSPIATFLMVSTSLSLLFSGIANAQNQNDPRDLLLNARENILDTIKRLPRYLCTQVVDRTRYEPVDREEGLVSDRHTRPCDDTVAAARRADRKRRLVSSDRLRLDVAVGQSVPGMESEMYSWAGENRFGDQDLIEFVHDGAVSTGSFSAMLAAIFGNNVTKFSYSGDSKISGRLLSEFGFRIGQEESSYKYVYGKENNQETPMAYDGTIFVDPETADLVRLVIRTAQLRPETGACELSQTLDYGRVRLNDADFLLPKQALVAAIHSDATESENRIQYSACREFRSKSVLRFPASNAEETKVSDTSAPATPQFALPPGLPFSVLLTVPIDTAQAAAGDPVRGKLKTSIRDSSKNILVPEGASVAGRIMSIKRYYDRPEASDSQSEKRDPGWGTILIGGQPFPTSESRNKRRRKPSLVLKIRLETLDFGGSPHPLNVAFDSGRRRFRKDNGEPSQRVDIGSLDPSQDSTTASFEFWDTSPDYVVNSGLESSWVTLAK